MTDRPNDADRQYALRRLERSKRTMGLQRWRIAFDVKEIEEYATVELDGDAETALITYSPAFWSLPAEERIETEAHELAHLYTTPLQETVMDLMPAKTRTATEKAIDTLFERLTNQIARMVAPRLEPWDGK